MPVNPACEWLAEGFSEKPPTPLWEVGRRNLIIDEVENSAAGGQRVFGDVLKSRLTLVENSWEHDRKKLFEAMRRTLNDCSWGAYSELVTFYYLLSENVRFTPFVEVDPAGAFLRTRGTVRIEKDGQFVAEDAYFEVKSLRLQVDEILDGVAAEACRNTRYVYVMFDFDFDLDYRVVQQHRAALRDMVEDMIRQGRPNAGHGPTGITARVHPGGVAVSEHAFGAYRAAEVMESFFVKPWNQLMRRGRNVTIYVHNSSMNRAITDFADMAATFYRAAARRVFVRLTRDQSELTSVEDGAPAGVTVSDVAKAISAIVFLHDSPYQPRDNLEASLFRNPNAAPECALRDYELEMIFDQPGAFKYDDFAHDNY